MWPKSTIYFFKGFGSYLTSLVENKFSVSTFNSRNVSSEQGAGYVCFKETNMFRKKKQKKNTKEFSENKVKNLNRGQEDFQLVHNY